jgi:hypothetical protein
VLEIPGASHPLSVSAPGDGRTHPGGGGAARGRLTTTTEELKMDTSLLAYPCAPHGITDTDKEQPGSDLLAFLNSTADVPELVGFSTGKDDA